MAILVILWFLIGTYAGYLNLYVTKAEYPDTEFDNGTVILSFVLLLLGPFGLFLTCVISEKKYFPKIFTRKNKLTTRLDSFFTEKLEEEFLKE